MNIVRQNSFNVRKKKKKKKRMKIITRKIKDYFVQATSENY